MKITLDIPDSTVCAFFNFIYYTTNCSGMLMQGHSIETDDMCDGAEIKIEPKEKVESDGDLNRRKDDML